MCIATALGEMLDTLHLVCLCPPRSRRNGADIPFLEVLLLRYQKFGWSHNTTLKSIDCRSSLDRRSWIQQVSKTSKPPLTLKRLSFRRPFRLAQHAGYIMLSRLTITANASFRHISGEAVAPAIATGRVDEADDDDVYYYNC